MPEINTQRLENFVARFTRLIESQPKEAALLTQGRELLHDLVKQDDWLVGGLREPHASHYQQYLLYLDPKERFSVVSFVWGPGQFTPIHDHTVWGLIGMLMGSEKCQPYSRMSDGRWVPAGLQLHLLPGDVEAVSPRLGDVHKVWNAFRIKAPSAFTSTVAILDESPGMSISSMVKRKNLFLATVLSQVWWPVKRIW